MKSFSVLKWISNIIGKNKIWIILLTLVQSIQGVLGVVFALSLREVIDSAVAKSTELMTKDIVILCIVVICMIVLALFTDRPFCNYLCTGGARMGLLSVMRIFGIRRNTQVCGGCGQCSRKCPMNIDVARTDFVRHPNCIGCLQCVSTCPKKCLSYSLMPTPHSKKAAPNRRRHAVAVNQPRGRTETISKNIAP